MKIFNYILLLINISLIVYFLMYIHEGFDVPTSDERPYVNIYGDNGDQLKIVMLSHPFTRDSSYKQHQEYRKDGFIILGISSYNEFPGISQNKLDGLSNPTDKAWNYDYMKEVDGWLHCFRRPEKYITDPNMPIAFISESDFIDHTIFKPDNSVKKIYDFIYVCPKDSDSDPEKSKDCYGWGAENKNWKLGKKCIEHICRKYKLKGLLVGRSGCEIDKVCDGLITTTNFLSRDELIKSYQQSKMILMANQSDASPRVLTEALCCNIPVLLNYNIVGGWKYINNDTGAFFTSENDIDKGLNTIINNLDTMTPRETFLKTYGRENTGKRLKDFIQKNYKDRINVDKYKYLKL